MHVSDFVDRLTHVKKTANGWDAQCPAHEDRVSSLSVHAGEDGKIVLHCHAGCSNKEIVRAMGLRMADLFNDTKPAATTDKRKVRGPIIAEYEYTDEHGNPLYKVRRHEGKDFSQQRWEDGGWKSGLGNVERVPYRLPAILKRIESGKTVFIVEGEKDVHTLESIGLVATCNSGGAGNWKENHGRWLRDANVVVLPDNDKPGRDHAVAVAKTLDGIASAIKIVELPGLEPKQDVSDWIQAGHTKQELIALCRVAEVWQAESTKELPTIVVSNRQQRDVTQEALNALDIGNNPPQMFQRAGILVRTRRADSSTCNTIIIDPITTEIIRCQMSRTANYVKHTSKGDEISTYPPMSNAVDVLAWGEWPFPRLDAITATPMMRPDGSILSEPGYDKETYLYYMPENGFELGPVPEDPTPSDLSEAKETIHDILADFPFVSKADYANAVGLMLTPIMRAAIAGCVPLAVVNAPQPGSGKGMLTRTVNIVTTGRDASMMTAPVKPEEWKKTITTQLMNGTTFITIDNVESKLYDPSLASVLTVAYWSDRLLGTNKSVDIPNRACFIATGNNVKLGGDIPRRCYWISINPHTSRPELRSGFRHSDLLDFVTRNRGKLVAALLTMARAWYAAGKPLASTPIVGSFEQWCHTVGGILTHAGIEGFLANAEERRQAACEDDEEWEGFLETLRDRFGSTQFTTQDVDRLIGSDETFAAALPTWLTDERDKKGGSFVRKLGKAFSRFEGKCYGNEDLHIAKTNYRQANKQHWRVETNQNSCSRLVTVSLNDLTPCCENKDTAKEEIGSNNLIEGAENKLTKTNETNQDCIFDYDDSEWGEY